MSLRSASFVTSLLTLCGWASLALAASNQAPVPQTSMPNGVGVVISGDSLTAGGEDLSNQNLETALSTDLGIPVINNGVGSQKSTQIAMRQGGVPIQLTFTGNIIPYNPTAVSAVQGAAIAGMATNQDPDYRFLSNVSSDSGQLVSGSVCGVHGMLEITASGGPPSTAQSYLFAPDGLYPTTIVLYATPQTCPPLSVFTPDLAAAQRVLPQIFWYGRNNNNQVAQIESDLAGSIAYLGHTNYLCLTIPNAEYEPSGSSAYAAIAIANAGIASTCRTTHTFDIRGFLISQYNPANPVDIYDHANDIVPYSLRAVIVRGTTGAINSTTATSFNVTAAMGTPGTGVLKVDGEYMLVTAVSGSTLTVTRGYAGSTPATHLSGAAFTITDNLHVGSNGDALAAAYIAANYKNVLLGTTPLTVPNNTALGGVLNFPNTWLSSQTFALPIYAGNGEMWEGSMCINQAYNTFTQSLTGPIEAVLCSTPGTGVITLGGAYNIGLCFTVGGGPACTVSVNNKGSLVTKGEVKGLTTLTSGATAGSPYITLPTDSAIEVNKTSGAATSITLMTSPATGQKYTIKDGKGDAATNVITITPGAGNVDGAASIAIGAAYGKVSLMWDGTEWVSL